MSQETALTSRKEQAALLVARDEKTDEMISAEVGIGRATLKRWKQESRFAQRVEEHRTTWREQVTQTGIAVMEQRVATLNDLHARMLTVIAERAQSPEMQDVPGGTTGLLVHQMKAIGTGQNQTVIDEYVFDAALVREIRAHQEQVAKELGQWVDRRENMHDVTVRQRPDLSRLSDDELAIIEQLAERALGPGRDSGGTGTPQPA